MSQYFHPDNNVLVEPTYDEWRYSIYAPEVAVTDDKVQKPEHFIETMTAFKEGDRINDHYKLMQSIAPKLTE